MKTLVDGLLEEMRRVRDQIMPSYILLEHSEHESERQSVAPALALMRRDLDVAARALAEHDGVTCMRIYQSLQGFTK